MQNVFVLSAVLYILKDEFVKSALKIDIWGGKPSVLWSLISFYSSAIVSMKNEICDHKTVDLPNDNFKYNYYLNTCI